MSQTLAIRGGTPVRTQTFPDWPIFDQTDEQAILRTLRSGKWGKIDGSEVSNFEKQFASFVQAKHAIAVVNGTVSLRIALLAAGLKAGDEVIVPPYTFLATATAVVEANAVPIFVDIDPATFNLDPSLIEAAITPRTRAIIPVHLGGLPCDMDAILAIARKHNLTVIEDAAHAHGSIYKSKPVGPIGHIGSFSFQSSKNLNAGEGGILVTNDDALADSIRSIHNCGRIKGGAWYEHHVISANYRLSELQGALLTSQLARLDAQTNTRDTNGRYLDAALSQIPGITPQSHPSSCTRNAQHLYLFRYDPKVYGVPRERFLAALAAEGIPASPGYVLPLYKQPLFLNHSFGPYSAAESVDYRALHLPHVEATCAAHGAWLYQSLLLGTQQDMDDIIHAYQKLYMHRQSIA